MTAFYGVNTLAASGLSSDSATLNGEITHIDTSNIDAVCAFFEYGTNSDLSAATRINPDDDVAIAVSSGETYSAAIQGLTEGLNYYYQAKARLINFDSQESTDYLMVDPISWGFFTSYGLNPPGYKEGILRKGKAIIHDFIHNSENDSKITEFWNNYADGLDIFYPRQSNSGSPYGLYTVQGLAYINIDLDFTNINTLRVSHLNTYTINYVTISVGGDILWEGAVDATNTDDFDVSGYTGVKRFRFEANNNSGVNSSVIFYYLEIID